VSEHDDPLGDMQEVIHRSARDYADQFHFRRGAGDDDAGWERDYQRARKLFIAMLVDHDRKVKSEALREAADAYPTITRDMVSRGSVRDWLRSRAEQGEPTINERVEAANQREKSKSTESLVALTKREQGENE